MNLELTSFTELSNEEQNMANKVAISCVKMYLSVAGNVRITFKNKNEWVHTEGNQSLTLFSL